MIYRPLQYALFFIFSGFYSSCQEFNINKEIGLCNLLDTVINQNKNILNMLDSTKLDIDIKTCENRIELLKYSEMNDLQEEWLKREINAYVNIKNKFEQIKNNLHFSNLEFTYCSKQIKSLSQDLVYRNISKEEFYTYFNEEHKFLSNLTKSTKNINKIYSIETTKFLALEFKLREIFMHKKSLKRKNTNVLK